MKNVFHSYKYYGLNPFIKIRNFFRSIKFCHQRITRGWCDADTWNMDTWFLEVIPPMLNHLRKNTHGHPFEVTEEEWNSILCKMIKLFNNANENQCSWYNPYEKEFDRIIYIDRNSLNKSLEYKSIAKKYWEIEKKKADYIKKCKNEAFKLFSKWFYDFWD